MTPYPNTDLPAGGYSTGAVPRAPLAPQNAARPSAWPGAAQSGYRDAGGNPSFQQARRTAPAYNPAQPGPPPMPIEGARILAKIDDDVILYSEVAGLVNQAVSANMKRYAGQLTPEQEQQLRDLILQQAIAALIPNKLLAAEARRTIPAENMPKVMEQFEETFEKTELPQMIERAGAKDRFDLEAKLRSVGTSLSREKRAYVEKTLGQQWMRQQINRDREIPRQQLLAYYEEHVADYEQPAQVRWQQLMKKPKRYRQEETEAETARLGNQLRRGAAFDEVARAHSDGLSASEGGWYDWTTIGGDELGDIHLSDELRDALVRLPVNRLSRIIEDNQGYHILRVVQRKPATRTPFEEVREEIEDKLRRESINRQVDEYIANLRERATIWTVFDEPTGQRQVTQRPGAATPYR